MLYSETFARYTLTAMGDKATTNETRTNMLAIATDGHYYPVDSIAAIMDITDIILKDTCTPGYDSSVMTLQVLTHHEYLIRCQQHVVATCMHVYIIYEAIYVYVLIQKPKGFANTL